MKLGSDRLKTKKEGIYSYSKNEAVNALDPFREKWMALDLEVDSDIYVEVGWELSIYTCPVFILFPRYS